MKDEERDNWRGEPARKTPLGRSVWLWLDEVGQKKEYLPEPSVIGQERRRKVGIVYSPSYTYRGGIRSTSLWGQAQIYEEQVSTETSYSTNHVPSMNFVLCTNVANVAIRRGSRGTGHLRAIRLCQRLVSGPPLYPGSISQGRGKRGRCDE